MKGQIIFIKLRRSIDNEEKEFASNDDGTLDTKAIAAWACGSDVYLCRTTSQFTYDTFSLQPQVVITDKGISIK
jgi:hypothetical protein